MSTITATEIRELQADAKRGDDDARDLLWLYQDDVTAEQLRLVRAEGRDLSEGDFAGREDWRIIHEGVPDEKIVAVLNPEMGPCDVLDAVERYVRENF